MRPPSQKMYDSFYKIVQFVFAIIQSLLLRAIAKEKYVNAINASGFIKKYNLKTARASTRHSNI